MADESPMSVKALASYFQSRASIPSIFVVPPADSERKDNSSKSCDITSRNSKEVVEDDDMDGYETPILLVGKPTPRPRTSLVKRNNSSSNSGDERVEEDNDRQDNQEEIEGLYEEINDLSCEESSQGDEEDIYEELPAQYHMIKSDQSPKKITFTKRLRKTSLTHIFMKGRRSLTSSLPPIIVDGPKFFRGLTNKSNSQSQSIVKLPPSVEELDRPLQSCNGCTSRSLPSIPSFGDEDKRNGDDQEDFEDEEEVYYDVRELGETNSSSDDYYESFLASCINGLRQISDDYEDIYQSSSVSERTYESLTSEFALPDIDSTTTKSLTSLTEVDQPPPLPPSNSSQPPTKSQQVEYVEIDSRKTQELERKIAKETERLEMKRKDKLDKLKRKFNLTGQEVPVNYGVIKEDVRGSRYKIKVKRGEIALILRMEGNPPGLCLAKNEREDVGYVELSNISCDPQVVKTLMSRMYDGNGSFN